MLYLDFVVIFYQILTHRYSMHLRKWLAPRSIEHLKQTPEPLWSTQKNKTEWVRLQMLNNKNGFCFWVCFTSKNQSSNRVHQEYECVENTVGRGLCNLVFLWRPILPSSKCTAHDNRAMSRAASWNRENGCQQSGLPNHAARWKNRTCKVPYREVGNGVVYGAHISACAFAQLAIFACASRVCFGIHTAGCSCCSVQIHQQNHTLHT